MEARLSGEAERGVPSIAAFARASESRSRCVFSRDAVGLSLGGLGGGDVGGCGEERLRREASVWGRRACSGDTVCDACGDARCDTMGEPGAGEPGNELRAATRRREGGGTVAADKTTLATLGMARLGSLHADKGKIE
jgi:hypothetical protein